MAERTESQENYIEVIHILSKKKPVVRSVDIANELGFKKPSVSIAMKSLKEQELKQLKKEFPQIEGAFSIKCTSPGYILQKTETQAIYIIQMNFAYYEN